MRILYQNRRFWQTTQHAPRRDLGSWFRSRLLKVSSLNMFRFKCRYELSPEGQPSVFGAWLCLCFADAHVCQCACVWYGWRCVCACVYVCVCDQCALTCGTKNHLVCDRYSGLHVWTNWPPHNSAMLNSFWLLGNHFAQMPLSLGKQSAWFKTLAPTHYEKTNFSCDLQNQHQK